MSGNETMGSGGETDQESEGGEQPLADPPKPSVAVIVATLGTSPYLKEALAAIHQQRKDLDLNLNVVSQGELPPKLLAMLDDTSDRHLRFPRPLGFAAANNAALREIWNSEGSDPEFLALVNDDAVIEPGWLSKLIKALAAHPQAAAAQGLNLMLQGKSLLQGKSAGKSTETATIDGAGIRWNRRLQAVQIDHGLAASRLIASSVTSIFGASATAAVFRTAALRSVVGTTNAAQESSTGSPRKKESARHGIFDEVLDTYYEDVDLACRLRRAGWEALLVPTALCHHAASSSAPRGRSHLLVANRHLVLARHLGRGYLPKVPSLLARDLLDFGATALPGWARATVRLPQFFHLAKGFGTAQLNRPYEGVVE